MNTQFEAVQPSLVLYNLFFKLMCKTNDELASLIEVDANRFEAMMRDEILFDKKTDKKICQFLMLPHGTILKMQNYYINYGKNLKRDGKRL